MPADARDLAGSRLGRLIRAPRGGAGAAATGSATSPVAPTSAAPATAQPATAAAPAAEERCDLCAQPIPPEHRHLLDVKARRIVCACRACGLLFDDREAGGGHYRRIPERVRLLEDFRLSDEVWAALRIPVELAFFFESSVAGHVVAFYPGPAGATESLLELDAWREIETANPVLRELETDVEALLVNRARGVREYWLAPIDACYALTGAIRTSWKGLGGGEEVWARIDAFFGELRGRAGGPRSGGAPEPRQEEAR